MNSRKPTLSVVIPTLGRPILIQTLESLAASEGFEDIEVFVAGKLPEGAVQEKLRALMEKYPQIRQLEVSFETGDSSRKKNAGFEASSADIVAFLDDDVIVAPDWPIRIVQPFEEEGVGLASGPSLVPDDVSGMGRLSGVALASKATGYVSGRYLKGDPNPRKVPWSRIIGCNMAYRREVLESIGEFDPAFWPGEEMIAAFECTRKGHALVFCPEAYVYHYPRQSLARFWKQMHGYGATRVRLVRAGTALEPITFVPMIWVLSLIVLGIGAFFSRIVLGLLVLDLVLYLLADLWITVLKFKETRRPFDLLLFFVVPLMHVSYGLAEWTEIFRPNKDLSVRSG